MFTAAFGGKNISVLVRAFLGAIGRTKLRLSRRCRYRFCPQCYPCSNYPTFIATRTSFSCIPVSVVTGIIVALPRTMARMV